MRYVQIFLTPVFLFFCFHLSAESKIDTVQAKTLNVLGSEAGESFHQLLLNRLQPQFDIRRKKLGQALPEKATLIERQKQLKKDYLKLLGELPPRTPLNPVVTGTIDCGSYTIEKVVIESRPDFHVTGNFYLPKKRAGKIPGIYMMSGHSDVGKAAETYQTAATLFAINGFAVFITDPVAQGERFQKITPEGGQAFPGLTLNHTLLDISSMLVGTDIVSYELWDNVRGLDYLAGRPEVDSSRLGITGNSGGGTQTTYLAGFDERIKAAAPSCYIASFEEKFFTIGSQDGCQQLYGEGLDGLEEQDLLFLAAPKPVRILSAGQDFFSFDGAQNASAELKKIYTCLGYPERTGQVSYPGPHGFARPLREAAVSWMKRWLMNDTVPVTEPENIKILSPDELKVTTSGQVLKEYPGEKTVNVLNAAKAEDLKPLREKFIAGKLKNGFAKNVKTLLRFEETAPEKITAVSKGVQTIDGRKVEKIIISRPGGCQLPALLFHPGNNSPKSRVVVFVDPEGKTAELKKGGMIESELAKGNYVFSVDLSGYGELRYSSERYWNDGFWNANLALYNGKPLFTWLVEDIIIAAEGLKKILPEKAGEIDLEAKGELCPAALHATVLCNDFSKATFVSPTVKSWKEAVINPYFKNGYALLVPGILSYYDLPDLNKFSKSRIVFR